MLRWYFHLTAETIENLFATLLAGVLWDKIVESFSAASEQNGRSVTQCYEFNKRVMTEEKWMDWNYECEQLNVLCI